MRKRSEAGPSAKPPAEERTVPIPGAGVAAGKAKCPACDEWVELAKCSTRPDGVMECCECGAALTGEVTGDGGTPAQKPPVQAVSTPPAPPGAPRAEAAPAVFCGECASEWPRVDGNPFPNCDHPWAKTVDHPSKAKRNSPPAGLQGRAQNVPIPEPPSVGAVRVFDGKLVVQWGKARCPIDRFNAFEVGGHSLTVDMELDGGPEKVAKIGRDALDALEKIAEEAFARQHAWYAKKLKLLGYESGEQ